MENPLYRLSEKPSTMNGGDSTGEVKITFNASWVAFKAIRSNPFQRASVRLEFCPQTKRHRPKKQRSSKCNATEFAASFERLLLLVFSNTNFVESLRVSPSVWSLRSCLSLIWSLSSFQSRRMITMVSGIEGKGRAKENFIDSFRCNEKSQRDELSSIRDFHVWYCLPYSCSRVFSLPQTSVLLDH